MSNSVKWVCYDQNNLLSHALVINPDLIVAIMLCQSITQETWLCEAMQKSNIFLLL